MQDIAISNNQTWQPLPYFDCKIQQYIETKTPATIACNHKIATNLFDCKKLQFIATKLLQPAPCNQQLQPTYPIARDCNLLKQNCNQHLPTKKLQPKCWLQEIAIYCNQTPATSPLQPTNCNQLIWLQEIAISCKKLLHTVPCNQKSAIGIFWSQEIAIACNQICNQHLATKRLQPIATKLFWLQQIAISCNQTSAASTLQPTNFKQLICL